MRAIFEDNTEDYIEAMIVDGVMFRIDYTKNPPVMAYINLRIIDKLVNEGGAAVVVRRPTPQEAANLRAFKKFAPAMEGQIG